MKLMKAVQFKFGGGHSIASDIPVPTPDNDELLVKVQYSALDTAHKGVLGKEMMGYFVHSRPEPLYLGYHFTGTVEATGPDVTDKIKGTEVFGFLQYEPSQKQGAFAEYIVVKEGECAVKPLRVSHAIAAASTTESLTALQAMRDLGGLKEGGGMSVLINGAGGGVGSAAVQIAKKLGARVSAVCSTGDVSRVEGWGADQVMDRRADPQVVSTLERSGDRFDVILDGANALPSSATDLLKPGGALVNTVPTPTFFWNRLKTVFSSKKVAFVECRSKHEDLRLVGEWLADGDLLIPVDSTFKVSRMEDAMKRQEGRKNGRVAIQVEGGWD